MSCWARYLLYLVIAGLGIANLVVACGQKGPLYLPEETPPATRPTARGADVPAAPPAQPSAAPATPST